MLWGFGSDVWVCVVYWGGLKVQGFRVGFRV